LQKCQLYNREDKMGAAGATGPVLVLEPYPVASVEPGRHNGADEQSQEERLQARA
jgi:hypothetical protein